MQGLNYGILLLNFGNCEGSKTNLHQPETRCDWNESSTRLGFDRTTSWRTKGCRLLCKLQRCNDDGTWLNRSKAAWFSY
ncbi:hypothetical protein Gasu2_37900 [Galdieria sulphuraria]|nr:hypothetical protein Gasu2_37900 [Galdieria sulphuraria]